MKTSKNRNQRMRANQYARSRLKTDKWKGNSAWDSLWKTIRNKTNVPIPWYRNGIVRMKNAPTNKESKEIERQSDRVSKRIHTEDQLYEEKKKHKVRVERDLLSLTKKKDQLSDEDFRMLANEIAVKHYGFEKGILQAEKYLEISKSSKENTTEIRKKIRYREKKMEDMEKEMARISTIMGRYMPYNEFLNYSKKLSHTKEERENYKKASKWKDQYDRFDIRYREYGKEIAHLESMLPMKDPLTEMQKAYTTGFVAKFEKLRKTFPKLQKEFESWREYWKKESEDVEKKFGTKSHIAKPTGLTEPSKKQLPSPPPSYLQSQINLLMKTIDKKLEILKEKIENIKIVSGGSGEVVSGKTSSHVVKTTEQLAAEEAEFRKYIESSKKLKSDVEKIETEDQSKKPLTKTEFASKVSAELREKFKSGKQVLENIETQIDEIDISNLEYHQKIAFREITKLYRNYQAISESSQTKLRNDPTLKKVVDDWISKYEESHKTKMF